MYTSSILHEYLRRYFSHGRSQYEGLLHAFHELGIPYLEGNLPLMYSRDMKSLKMLAYRNNCIKNLRVCVEVSIQVLGMVALRSTLPNTCEFDTLQSRQPLHFTNELTNVKNKRSHYHSHYRLH